MVRVARLGCAAFAAAAACSLDNRALSIASSGGRAGGAGGALATIDGGDDTPARADGGGGSDLALGARGNGSGTFDLTSVYPTVGCGQDPGQALGMLVRGTIQTMGTKQPNCADANCAPWSYLREYYVQLPVNYDRTHAYPIIFEGHGCGATGLNIYALPDLADSVIRVGLTPPPNAIGHAPPNRDQGCFDDAEGDDSVEWPFYENLYDKLAGHLCFDRNRVFAAGNEHGATMADQLACKYAGDATRPIRGVLSNGGGLASNGVLGNGVSNPQRVPTCSDAPLAGIWISQTSDPAVLFAYTKNAIARAMNVDRCTIGTSFDDAELEDFPIGGGNSDTTCKTISGCPDLTPLVVCAIGGVQNSSNDGVANPGFSTFVRLFEDPTFLTEPTAAVCGFPMPNVAASGLPNPASYVANADGTVTDRVTGLTWEGAVDALNYTQEQAARRCTDKGVGWRLPTRLELISLLDFTAPGPSVDETVFNTPLGAYWTSSSAGNAVPGSAWAVANGGLPASVFPLDVMTGSALALCVSRSGTTCSPIGYEAAVGVVLDRATGLRWQETVDAGSYSWDEADAHCAALGTGWRVPSVKELLTIVDDSASTPAVDEVEFPSTPSGRYWTSSTIADDASRAWSVVFGFGQPVAIDVTTPGPVRCVR
jgi:hypothetical protein